MCVVCECVYTLHSTDPHSCLLLFIILYSLHFFLLYSTNHFYFSHTFNSGSEHAKQQQKVLNKYVNKYYSYLCVFLGKRSKLIEFYSAKSAAQYFSALWYFLYIHCICLLLHKNSHALRAIVQLSVRRPYNNAKSLFTLMCSWISCKCVRVSVCIRVFVGKINVIDFVCALAWLL